MSFFLRILFLGLILCSAYAFRPDYFSTIEPHAKTSWGSWGPISWCPGRTFANGMRLKVERPQGAGDDTAVNAVELGCLHGGAISSTVGPWGGWELRKFCSLKTFIIGVAIRSEPSQGRFRDDTAANNFAFYCWDQKTLVGHGTPWGSWSSRVNCPIGTAMCGIQTMVEPKQGAGDDTALNRARFFCCRL